MAKPKPATDLAALASPATSPSSSRPSRPHCTKPNHSRRRRHSASILSPAPSKALLASLATVAAACSAADGRPLAADSSPPDFLCPFLPLDVPQPQPSPAAASSSKRPPKRALDSDSDHDHDPYPLTPTPTRTRRFPKRRDFVVDKYVQGDDGRWRKEPTWSLYGSSYCECTADTTPPESGIPQVDDQVDPTNLTSSSTETPRPSTTDMSDSLPPGWPTNRSSSKDLTAIILTLSLTLALIICILIFGCVVWRRKRRARLHADLEKKQKKLQNMDDEQDTEESRRMRSYQRKWAKASAKWKANVRTSVRRRRKRTQTAPSIHDVPPHASSLSLASHYSYTSAVPSQSAKSESVAANDVAVFPTLDADDDTFSSRNNTHVDGETPRGQDTDGTREVPPDLSRPTLPPEYPVDGTLPGAHSGPLAQSAQRSDLSEPGAPPFHASLTYTQSSLSDPDHLPYTAPVNAAHIATDDKTLLARMANMASHPPVEGSARENAFHGESAATVGPSVPILDEFEELPMALQVVDEDGPSGSRLGWYPTISASSAALPSLSIRIPVPTYSREPSPRPPMFPAPPTKAQLAAPLFYEYPSAFEEDGLAADLDAPSAPPFDFVGPGPSAPPLDGASIDVDPCAACAPPLIDEDEEIQLGFVPTAGPSAPPLPPPPPHSAVSPSEVSAGRRTGHASPPPEAGPSPLSSVSPPLGRAPSAPYSDSLSRAASPPDYLP